MRRALFCFKKVGLEVIPYPAGFRSKNVRDIRWFSFLPRSSSLEVTSDALHEYLGILFYKLAY